MRDGFIEIAAHDPQQGVIFYTLDQKLIYQPIFKGENERCLRCHLSGVSLGVPDGRPLLVYGGFTSDHRSALEERWGGWYVTGKHSVGRHLGNALMADSDQPESVVTSQTVHLESPRASVIGRPVFPLIAHRRPDGFRSSDVYDQPPYTNGLGDPSGLLPETDGQSTADPCSGVSAASRLVSRLFGG